jgi:hypothetical protein
MTKRIAMKKVTVRSIIFVLFSPFFALGQGNGLYQFIGQNGKYGFMDKTGKVVISAKYIRIWYPGFSDGLVFVSEEKASNGDFVWICIDTLGEKKFSLEQRCSPQASFSEGYAVINNWEFDKYWFVNKAGEQVFDKKFGYACAFTNGFARVSDEKFGYSSSYFIDKKGERAKHLPSGGSIFDNGISYCGRKLIDTSGNVLIDNIHEWTGASYEFLKVRRNDKWGFIDRKGNIVIDFQYEEDRRREFDKDLKLNTDSLDALPKAIYRNVGFFHDGLASIQKDSLFGFINLENEIVIEPIFKKIRYFSEGLAGASLDGIKWGFINKEGIFVIEPQYFFVDAFKHGICGVLLTNVPQFMNDWHLNAIINKEEEILYRGEMHSYRGFKGELIQYYDGGDFRGRIHYLDKNGQPVIPKE